MQVAKPDTEYRIEQFSIFNDRETFFYLHRTEKAVFDAVEGLRGEGRTRLLDVGCGLGMQAARFARRGWESYGVDASDHMLRLGQFRFHSVHKRVRLARGVAEALPFGDARFDVVMCQGAMDHFADHRQFLAEVERVLRPGGHFVVALANYESLACRVGRALDNVSRLLGVDTPNRYKFWRIPGDHTFRGSYHLLKEFGNGRMRVKRLHGASMFLFLPPWRELLDSLSFELAGAVFHVVDRIAYRFPSEADVVIGVLRKEDLSPDVDFSGLLRLQLEARGNGKKRSSAVPLCPP
jgi:SAM-dependent methyltransferase